jgi:hypothetical protein
MSALDLTNSFAVNWRLGPAVLPVFVYDAASRTFSTTAFAAGRASMEFVTGDINWGAFLIGGEYVAFWNDVGEFSVSKLSDDVPAKNTPYLEFFFLRDSVPQRMTTLTKSGDFGCAGLSDDAIPAGSDHLYLSDSVSIEPSGFIRAWPLKEIDLWVDENGDYFADESEFVFELGDIVSDQQLFADEAADYFTDEAGRIFEIS